MQFVFAARMARVFLLFIIFGSLAAPRPQLTSNYPNSLDGLKAFLAELFHASANRDSQNISRKYSELAIPNHMEWFLSTFGNKDGLRLEARYLEFQAKTADYVRSRVELAIQLGQTDVAVGAAQKPEDTREPLLRAALTSAQHPTAIYFANCPAKSDSEHAIFLGDFVYVDGSFRYLDSQVFQGLSNAVPSRITVGPTDQRAKIIKKVPPEYSSEARRQRIQGTVILHVILARDGKVAELDVVSGDPKLRKAAIKAVKQWRYEPTLVYGQPVEVDTQINVIFQIAN